jgi:PAS domain S-box-containing protein
MQVAARQRVLLVDDEPQVLVALEDLLSDRFIVFKSESAVDALDIIQRERDIAVVITDQRMPKMNGDELLAALGETSDASRIMVTGFADLSAVIRAVNDGKIFAYVTKPWNAEDLRLKVRKAAEHFSLVKELADERQLLHDLMDSIPDGIYFKDRALRFRRANRSFAAMVQAPSPESLVGTRLRSSPFVEVGAGSDEEERLLLARGELLLDVVREQAGRADSKRWFSETKAPVRNHAGEVIGLVGIARDVTERVSMGEALRTSEARFREQSQLLNSILESMGDGVIVTDRQGRLLLVNPQAEKLFGMPGPSMLSPEWAQSFGVYQADGKTLLAPEQNPLLRAVTNEETSEIEVVVRNRATSGTVLAIHASPLRDSEHGVLGGVALLRDVTRQTQLEQQLMQSQKMEAVGQLAGGVAHDFNNLLSVIQSYGQLVLRGLPEGDPSREDLGQLLTASQRAAALTRQLLAFSRRQVVQPRLLQVNDVVTEVEKMLRRLIGDDISLVVALSPDLGIVRADPGQLEQIIVNLAVNARDAMPGGGTLTIETANVMLDASYASAHVGVKPGEFVMLAASDTGVGMDDTTRERVFEPFFTTKEVGKGTGLGLSMVYGIVQQSGGCIWVYSEVSRGSSFKLYFPRVDGHADASPLSEPSAQSAAQIGTILLVEDNDAVRLVAARILRDRGYTVVDTGRVDDARAYCARAGSTFDLLVTDVVMPGTSGPKLAEELTAAYPRMRVLYMSGYPGAAIVQGGALGAGVAYVEKPFTPTSLVEKVQQVLQSAQGGTRLIERPT